MGEGAKYVPYWVKKEMPKRHLKVSKPNVTMKGHTAFLTFAYSPVAPSPAASIKVGDVGSS